jgi:hypothetical protein
MTRVANHSTQVSRFVEGGRESLAKNVSLTPGKPGGASFAAR